MAVAKCLENFSFGKFCICYKNVTKNVSFSMSENFGQISPFVNYEAYVSKVRFLQMDLFNSFHCIAPLGNTGWELISISLGICSDVQARLGLRAPAQLPAQARLSRAWACRILGPSRKPQARLAQARLGPEPWLLGKNTH